MNPDFRPRRLSVSLRPKVRSQRMRQRSAIAAVVLLGAAAALTLRHLKSQFPAPADLASRLGLSAASIEVRGVPEAFRAEALSFVGSRRALSPDEKASELKKRFSALREVRASRKWLSRGVRFDLEPHRPVARAAIRGRSAGYLSETGELFEAPEGLLAQILPSGDSALPAAEVGGAGRAELKALAIFFLAAGSSAELFARLDKMRYVSPDDGWEAAFSDGTTALWGSLERTPEKLSRLREVVADARGQSPAPQDPPLGGDRPGPSGSGPGPVAADLRYFEDGKILVRTSRQAGQRPLAAR